MAITYTKFPVDWDNEGTKPSQDIIESGFSAGYKPPAEYFNAIFHDTAEAIREIQSKTADFSVTVETSMNDSEAHGENASLHIIDATCTYADSVYSLVLSKSVGNANYFCLRFKAPNTFVSSSKFSVNGVSYSPVNAEFEANDVVILNFDKSQAKCFFVTGGGGEEIVIATQDEAVAATDNTKMMTPLRVKNQIDGRIATQDEAEAATDNTKIMTPLRVRNQITARIATEDEAASGNNNTKIMTPLRVKGVIDDALASYTPNVEVPEIATQTEATEATDNTKIMTPLRVKNQIDSRIATSGEAQNGTDNTKIMTPFRVNQVLLDYALKSDIPSISTADIPEHATQEEVFNLNTTKYISARDMYDYLYNGGITVGEDDIGYPQFLYLNIGSQNAIADGSGQGWAFGEKLNMADRVAVFGKSNKTPSSTSINTTSGDLFVIGNGLSSSRTNAFRVTAAGDVMGTKSYAATGADYAEMFEWLDGNADNADRRGLFVTLDGEKIRLATADDDYILGVVSATPSVVADAHSDDWCKKWETDIFGERLLDENGAWILNKEFKEEDNEKYVSRADRKEWAAVGMVGKLIVVDDGTCEVNGYCYPTDGGTATKSDKGFRVISRIDETHIKVIVK